MNFWNIPIRKVLLSPFCPGGKSTVWKTEELAQNYTASKWFEIGIQLIGFLPGSLSITPTLGCLREVPAFILLAVKLTSPAGTNYDISTLT